MATGLVAGASSSFLFALKTLYPQQRIFDAVYETSPLFALMKKETNFVGKNMSVPVRFGNPQGRNATFASALNQANSSGLYSLGVGQGTSGKDFIVYRQKDYAFINVDNDVLLASESDQGAFLSALEDEMKGAIAALTQSLGGALFRGTKGFIGVINSTDPETTISTSADTFTVALATTTDIVNFEVGQVIEARDPSTPTTIRAADNGTAGSKALVVAVDRDAGTILVKPINGSTGAHITTITATDFAAGDTLNIVGDYNSKILGLADWIPYTAPSAGESFLTVDRSVDPVRLAGQRADVSTLDPEEQLITGLTRMAPNTGKPTHAVMNPDDWRGLALALGSKVQTEYMTLGTIGFEYFKVHGPKGAVVVLADPFCPLGYAYLLDMSVWAFASLGDAPRIVDIDGNTTRQSTVNDGTTALLAVYGNLICRAPGANMVLKLR
jgi:hypothetical protein